MVAQTVTLCHVLSTGFPHLTSLHMTNTRFTKNGQDLQVLARGLAPTLVALCLDSCIFPYFERHQLFSFSSLFDVSALSALTKLRSLSIFCQRNPVNASVSCDSLVAVVEKCQGLVELRVPNLGGTKETSSTELGAALGKLADLCIVSLPLSYGLWKEFVMTGQNNNNDFPRLLHNLSRQCELQKSTNRSIPSDFLSLTLNNSTDRTITGLSMHLSCTFGGTLGLDAPTINTMFSSVTVLRLVGISVLLADLNSMFTGTCGDAVLVLPHIEILDISNSSRLKPLDPAEKSIEPTFLAAFPNVTSLTLSDAFPFPEKLFETVQKCCTRVVGLTLVASHRRHGEHAGNSLASLVALAPQLRRLNLCVGPIHSPELLRDSTTFFSCCTQLERCDLCGVCSVLTSKGAIDALLCAAAPRISHFIMTLPPFSFSVSAVEINVTSLRRCAKLKEIKTSLSANSILDILFDPPPRLTTLTATVSNTGAASEITYDAFFSRYRRRYGRDPPNVFEEEDAFCFNPLEVPPEETVAPPGMLRHVYVTGWDNEFTTLLGKWFPLLSLHKY
eukprot:PhM_4_TR14248/c0_g1_i2/m.63007